MGSRVAMRAGLRVGVAPWARIRCCFQTIKSNRWLCTDTSGTTFITTPIFYVNGAPHIGHAYTAVLTHVVARWSRMRGRTTMLLTGTDEHGQKVQRAAESAGIEPIELCDAQAARFASLFGSLQMTEDRFIRTTEAAHHTTVAAVWEALYDAGHIYKGVHEGWYSVSDEAYYTEMQVTEKMVPDPQH